MTQTQMLETYPGDLGGLDKHCADVCLATGRALSRHTGYDANPTRSFLEVCATVCKACGAECAQHAEMHEHCRVCPDACRRCEGACRTLLTTQ